MRLVSPGLDRGVEPRPAARDDRAGLEDCIGFLREHDQLLIASIDRLARSLTDLQGLIDQIAEKGASVHFIKEGLTFATGREIS